MPPSTRRLPWLLPLAMALHAAAAAGVTPPPRSPTPGITRDLAFDAHILVDQFGYRPEDPKVAVVRNPQVGFDAADKISPGTGYQLRRAADGAVVFSGDLSPWKGGATDPSSGDGGWWFDFTAVTQPDTYFIFDPKRKVRSATFVIQEDVYRKVLRAALKTFYYQRSGYAKQRPYAAECWIDEPAYLGIDQDAAARDVTDPENRSKVRNVSGGWFDAGDTNKYVTFAVQPVHQLLSAYQENPAAFTDDFNIPESGNGIPDLIDEVKWEIDWLKKMQNRDGSAALKVGEKVYAAAAPPSRDHSTRYYIPTCTSSTIAVAGMFAHAAYVFAKIPQLAGDALDLQMRAIAAWNNYFATNPKQTHCDSGVIHAGIADWSEEAQGAAAAMAAIYLYAATESSSYEDYVKAHYRDLRPYRDFGWSRYNPEQGEALLFYATFGRADPTLRRTILADKLKDVRASAQVYGFRADDDLYRSFMPDEQYHWGSNNPRAGYGNTNIDVITFGVEPEKNRSYQTRALDVIHYFHGVNPFALVYLSNMYEYGATRSVNEIFHAWFARDTKWGDALTSECGPAPGFIPGGPNVHAADGGVPASLRPPTGQPPQKSYRDWNMGSPENSWTISEPAIYYESGYVKLLSKFVH